jgi:hypothetical protein
MRRAILGVLDTDDAHALRDIVRESLAGHRAELMPAT